jgi:DNA-binding winged helix-turn-helix (wHTH) protein
MTPGGTPVLWNFWFFSGFLLMRIRFGDCAFDGETRELERAGKVAHLSPKAFALLELLLASRPNAISKTELQEKIWPHVFVSEENLAALASEVRRAIGDSSRRPRFLRTVYGFGYAFSGEAEPETRPSAPPRRSHALAGAFGEIELHPGENIVGRDADAAVRLDDPTVSRRHAKITVEGETATIEDLDSKNGTFVEGRRIRSNVRLKSGARLTFGSVQARYRAYSPQISTEAVRPERRRPAPTAGSPPASPRPPGPAPLSRRASVRRPARAGGGRGRAGG